MDFKTSLGLLATVNEIKFESRAAQRAARDHLNMAKRARERGDDVLCVEEAATASRYLGQAEAYETALRLISRAVA